VTENEFLELLARGHELPGVEFKGPGPRTDKPLFARVTRAVLGMSNHRDGGLVIIGVAESEEGFLLRGVSDKDLDTWKYDDVAEALTVFSDPSVSFEMEIFPYEGNNFVILSVSEFEDIPVLCRKTYNHKDPKSKKQVTILREGACYVRTKRKPETSEIPSQTEMRDLLDLATDKGLQKFVRRARAAEIAISRTERPSDQERFDKQLGDLK
jgi:predicted HTH transcriptional regulator